MGDNDLHERTVEITVSRDLAGFVRPTAAQHAYLVVLSGPRIGHRTLLGTEPVVIGRGSKCGLMLDADSVSRQHARIEWTGTAHRLVDLGSTNGSFVNEVRISDHVLMDGDRPQIGKVLLKYISGANVEANYHDEVQRLMRYDGLTGAANKGHFDEALRSAVAHTRAQPASIALIVFDLDHFKNINDTHGHTAGDAVLRQVSDVVRSQLGEAHLFARVGGEEFAVLWPGGTLAGARALAENIRAAVENTRFMFEETVIPVTVSLGVAERPVGGTVTDQQLYGSTDERLYEAKRSGRNRVC